MSHFYRYLHPLLFDEKRKSVYTPPNGGICMRILPTPSSLPVTDDSKCVTVSYSLCDLDTPFDKEVAKHIADQRFEADHFHMIWVRSYATNVIAMKLTEHASIMDGLQGACTQEIYMTQELLKFAIMNLAIRGTHHIAWDKEKLHHDIRMAMHIGEGYARKAQDR